MCINQQILDEFKKIDPKNIKNNIFQDLDFEGYCFNVHDTDTISILFKYTPLSSEIIKYNIRIAGIDSPELHSQNLYERELCIKGTEYLKSLILYKMLKIKTKKIDKYGRMLADLYTLDLNNSPQVYINQDLIDNGYCRVYNGKAKKEWNLINSNQLHLQINTTTPTQIDTTTPTQIDTTTPVIPRIKRKYVKQKKIPHAL